MHDLGAVEACLRTEVARRPFDLPAMTALSRILLQEYRLGVKPSDGADPIAAADALAVRALELGPEKSRAFKSVFEVRFFQRRYDEAFKAADRAIEINPFAADVLSGSARRASRAAKRASQGAARSRGRAQSGAAALDRVLYLSRSVRAGRRERRRARRRLSGDGNELLGLLARAIVANQRKDADAKHKSLLALAKAFPTVAADIPGALERYGLTAPLRQQLLAALNPAQPTLNQ